MRRVLALVEGQTEEAFIGRCVKPHLWPLDVHLDVKIIETKRVLSGPNFKGGVSSWNQIARDLKLLLSDSSAVAVTTMFDYYGLPADVPGMGTRPDAAPDVKARHVQAAMESAVGDPRFRANLLLHEFEALLYSDPGRCGAHLRSPNLSAAMQAAVTTCGAPELVNDDPASAPSRRILAAHPGYAKRLDGPAIAEEIGLQQIRASCPHFDSWLAWLEGC